MFKLRDLSALHSSLVGADKDALIHRDLSVLQPPLALK